MDIEGAEMSGWCGGEMNGEEMVVEDGEGDARKREN